MNHGTLSACSAGFGVSGGLLGWSLHGHPTLAAVTLRLVIVGDALAWQGELQIADCGFG
jgi:hypothetical protein